MLKRYENVILLCPANVTGGPEAIHQLAQLTNELGIPTVIAYYGRGGEFGGRIHVENGVMRCTPALDNPCMATYAKYNPIPATVQQITDRTLVILPEVRIGERHLFGPGDVAIWWLSVNNAFHPRSPLHTDEGKRAFFGDRTIHHFCQTFYSRALLRQNGVEQVYDLVDYTDDLFTLQPPRTFNEGASIAYNPKKGAEIAAAFFAQNPDLSSRRIENMTKRDICDVFRQTRIYLEFGHNPGKDRMPREAACAGCIVLAHKQGGTAFFDDVPLDDQFKFTADDVASGRLGHRVRTIAADPEPAWQAQSFYRRYLRTERDLMRVQAARLFAS